MKVTNIQRGATDNVLFLGRILAALAFLWNEGPGTCQLGVPQSWRRSQPLITVKGLK